jgi:hypothetical protein
MYELFNETIVYCSHFFFVERLYTYILYVMLLSKGKNMVGTLAHFTLAGPGHSLRCILLSTN